MYIYIYIYVLNLAWRSDLYAMQFMRIRNNFSSMNIQVVDKYCSYPNMKRRLNQCQFNIR